MPAARQPSRLLQVILAIGIFLTALNMRITIVSVPPLMDIVREDNGLSSSAADLIVTLPIICFPDSALGGQVVMSVRTMPLTEPRNRAIWEVHRLTANQSEAMGGYHSLARTVPAPVDAFVT